jgi:hypothetical protein
MFIYYLIVNEGRYLVIGIPVFILFAIIYPILLYRTLKIVLSKKPGLSMDKVGIIDNVGIAKLGTINWEDINNVRVVKQHMQNFILLDLKNNNKYIENKLGMQKNQIKISIDKFGTPSLINASNLDYDLGELVKIIKGKIQK